MRADAGALSGRSIRGLIQTMNRPKKGEAEPKQGKQHRQQSEQAPQAAGDEPQNPRYERSVRAKLKAMQGKAARGWES